MVSDGVPLQGEDTCEFASGSARQANMLLGDKLQDDGPQQRPRKKIQPYGVPNEVLIRISYLLYY